mgnify:CR=1 FL=1
MALNWTDFAWTFKRWCGLYLLTSRAGASASQVSVSGVLLQSTTAVGNVGGGEDDLISLTVPAKVLSANGDRLRVTGIFTFAANANTKTTRGYFGATKVAELAASTSGSAVRAVVIITRTAAATQQAWGTIELTGGSGTLFSTPAETLSGTVAMKFTGQSAASATDDIIQKEMVIEYLPAP